MLRRRLSSLGCPYLCRKYTSLPDDCKWMWRG